MPDQQQQINYGAAPNDGQGDPLRDAFIKTDDNFDAIWAAGPVGSNITILNNTVAVVNTNGNLVLQPNGVGVIQANASIVPDSANIRDLGVNDRRWRRIFVQTLNTVDFEVDGDLTVSGNLTIQGDTIQIGNLVTDAKTLQLSNTAANAAQAAGSGITVGANDDIATLLYDSGNDSWNTDIGFVSSGNISAAYFIGNGSALSGLPVPYTDTDVVNLLGSGNVVTDITTSANVSAAYILGNGSQLTGLPEQYGNSNVASYLPTYTGNLTGERLIVQNGIGNAWTIYGERILAPSGGEWRSENDSGDDFITSAVDGYINLQSLYADGNIASEIKLEHGVARIVVADAPFAEWTFNNTGQLDVPGNIVPTANGVYSLGSESLQWANLWVASNTLYIGGVPVGITGNVLTVNGQAVLSNDSDTTITTTGNITAGYFIGNGSQLTGLPESYSDVNVATFLAAFGSNTVLTTGNVTVGNLITGNGDSLILGNTNSRVRQNSSNATIALSGSITLTPDTSASALNGVVIGGSGYLLAPNGSRNAELNYGGGSGTMGIYMLNIYGGQATAITNGGANGVGNIGANTSNRFNTAFLTAVNASGNVTANYFIGNGSQLTGLPAGYSDSNVSTFLSAFGSNTIVTTGNISAGNVIGDGSQLSDVNAVTLDVTNTNGLTTVYYPTFVENRTTGQTARADVDLTYRTDTNTLTVGNISSAGNITSAYFIGNGSALTGVTVNVAGNIIGTQSNVYLVAGSYTWGFDNLGNLTLPGNTFAVNYANGTAVSLGGGGGSGTVTNVQGDGTVSGITLTGNVSTTGNLTLGGTLDLSSYSGNITTAGNIAGGYILGNGSQLTGLPASYGDSNVVTLLASYGSNTISTTGNITAGDLIATGNVLGNVNGFAIGYRDIPQVSLAANTTISTADAGKHYYSTSASTLTLTIANNASQSFAVGATINIINQGAGNVSVLRGSGVTMYLAGNSTSSDRTLTSYGVASVTKVSSDTWFISGVGLI